MSTKAVYGHVSTAYKKNLVLQIGGKEMKAVGYEGHTFSKGVPESRYEYYARNEYHALGIKKNKGVTVNFWGTIITKKPIDFGEDTEVTAKIISIKDVF